MPFLLFQVSNICSTTSTHKPKLYSNIYQHTSKLIQRTLTFIKAYSHGVTILPCPGTNKRSAHQTGLLCWARFGLLDCLLSLRHLPFLLHRLHLDLTAHTKVIDHPQVSHLKVIDLHQDLNATWLTFTFTCNRHLILTLNSVSVNICLNSLLASRNTGLDVLVTDLHTVLNSLPAHLKTGLDGLLTNLLTGLNGLLQIRKPV